VSHGLPIPYFRKKRSKARRMAPDFLGAAYSWE
jgi:hypothetical protein